MVINPIFVEGFYIPIIWGLPSFKGGMTFILPTQGIGGLQGVVLYALPELDGAIDAVALGGLSSGGDIDPWWFGGL